MIDVRKLVQGQTVVPVRVCLDTSIIYAVTKIAFAIAEIVMNLKKRKKINEKAN